MTNNGQIYEEMERSRRINEEFKRISFYFEKLEENEKSIIFPLIQNAAFMRVTLEDLQQIIAEQGPVEAYQNGANQHGMKQSAALQSYNALVKNYAAVIKNLFCQLPPMERPKHMEIVLPAKSEPEELKASVDDEIDRAVRFQEKQRELDDLIESTESDEERQRLINERNHLSFSNFH